MELEEGGRYSWGLSLEAEFEDNTNWNLDSSDDEEFDALYSKEVLRDIEQLETMVQMCTNALSPNAGNTGSRSSLYIVCHISLVCVQLDVYYWLC